MKKILTGLILFSVSYCSFAQMSGTYTVNQNAIASTTNFVSFKSLTDSLQAQGVNGAVTINVVANSGPYRERVEFTNISGFTNRNPLVLNGNGNEIISVTTPTRAVTLYIDGVENVTVDNFIITLNDSTTYNILRDVLATNGKFENLDIKNCVFKINRRNNGNLTNSRFINLSSNTTNQNLSYIRNLNIANNKTLGGGFYGIFFILNTTQYDTTFRGIWNIVDNELNKINFGIYIYSHRYDSLKIKNNKIGWDESSYISNNNAVFNGIYVYDHQYYYNYFNKGYTEISNNIIRHGEVSSYVTNPGATGITCYTISSNGCRIFNNIIELKGRSNIFINIYNYYYYYYSKSKIDVANNTLILLDDTTRTNQVSAEFIRFYYYNGYLKDSSDVRNNLFYSEARNVLSLIGVNTRLNSTQDSFVAINNNLFYSATTPFTSYLNGYICSVVTPQDTQYCKNFKSNNLMNVNPNFASRENLMYVPTNGLVYRKGVPIDYLTKDIFGARRSKTAPQIGAIESLDGLVITELHAELDTLICSNQEGEFSFIIENKTGLDLQNVGVNLAVNGEVRLTESFGNNMKRGDIDTLTFSKKLMLNGQGPQKIDIYAVGTNLDSTHLYQSLTITLKPTPFGADIIPNKSTNNYFYDGDILKPDVVLVTDELNYQLKKPTQLSLSNFGTDWGIKNLSSSDSLSSVDTAKGLSWNMTNESLKFRPKEVLDGQRVLMKFLIENYQNGCDTAIERNVRVLSTPQISFEYNFNCLGESTQFINTTKEKGTDKLLAKWDLGENGDTSDFWSTEYFYLNKGVKNVGLKIWFQDYPKYEFVLNKSTLITPYPEPNFRMIATCAKSESQFTDLSKVEPGNDIFATYHWSFGDSSTVAGINNPRHKYLQGGGYDVNLEIDILGCKRNITKRVNVLYTPEASFEVKDICLGDTLFVKNNSSILKEKMVTLWDFNAEGSSFAAQPTYLFDQVGKKKIRLIARSEFGCADTLSKEISVGAIPELELSKSPICVNVLAGFSVKNVEAAANVTQWEWKLNENIVSNGTTYSNTFDTVGDNLLEILAISDLGCKTIMKDTLVVLNRVIADFKSLTVCQGEEIQFQNTSKVTGGNVTYRWFFGTGDTSNEVSPFYTYGKVFGTVSVTLDASVVEGCTDQVVKQVNISKAPTSKFNVISKNGNNIGLRAVENDAIYNWDMGDGSRYSTQEVQHLYTNIPIEDVEICLSTRNYDGCKSIDDKENCWRLSPTGSAALLSQNDNSIQLYPNPSNGNITVKTTQNFDYKVQVYDMLGKLIFEEANAQQIYISQKGAFVVRIKSELGLWSSVVVVE